MEPSDPKKEIAGRLFDSGSSRFQPGTIRCLGDRVLAFDADGNQTVSAPLGSVQIDPPVRGMPWRVRFPNGQAFESNGPTGFDMLFGREAGRVKRFHGLTPMRWTALILASLALPFVLWFGYPIAADNVARAVPVSLDRSIGQSTFRELDGAVFDKSELPSARKAKMRAIFTEILRASDLAPGRARLVFRKSDYFGANAFALPDGTVVMLDDLVALAESDDEIAGVLAHEVAHIRERHSMRQVVRAAGISVLALLILGDGSSFAEEIAAMGAGIVQFSYNREFETEADLASAQIMRKLGRDPNAMIALLRRVYKDCGESCEETSILSTHPGLRDRLETVSGGE
ncbi:M48 family metallopeptidase [Rhodospirillaceae bacterium KN72]|uniref:M48 family metallopeptidase n=1 Tax=Pacificispira spongiicola TaxID=2729598 RepID=A0A7Y0HDS2_9PROT|nr:M48 family metallopeptidase [Pacificispira spongiicola]NMM44136.1 M48 family metallopeptidase [Pacificispira spongiicola]